jgi:hypothetical protein
MTKLSMPGPENDVKQVELSHAWVGGVYNGTNILEKNLTAPKDVKHASTL